ncbi:hypothetical protein Tco_1072947, partial [Tanacetum coccineum]
GSSALPSNFKEVATGVLKVLNNLAVIDINFIQMMLVSIYYQLHPDDVRKGYHTKRQKTKKKMTKPGTEWKSCEGQSQIKAKDQKSQSQSQLNKLTVKTGAVIEEYYWMQSQPI